VRVPLSRRRRAELRQAASQQAGQVRERQQHQQVQLLDATQTQRVGSEQVSGIKNVLVLRGFIGFVSMFVL
jgi:hypothetical protein